MSVCTFFGHRRCPSGIKERLRDALVDLIERQGVTEFYVGREGEFDHMVRSVLRELSQKYPHITYGVVLAYLPGERRDALAGEQEEGETMYPEGLETVPRRYAIGWRNRWMLHRADIVVTYVTHGWGGAAKFAEMAQRAGRRVIPLGGSDQKHIL